MYYGVSKEIREQAIAIVKEMVAMGYHTFTTTEEEFAHRFNYDVDLLTSFKKNFERHLNK